MIRRLTLRQEIKLYAGLSPISRRGLWTAQQRRHLVFEILEAALRGGRGNRWRGLFTTGRRAARRRLGLNRRRADTWVTGIAGRAGVCRFEPLRHFGEILVCRRNRRSGRRRRSRG